MPNKPLPAATEIVEARRKLGHGTVYTAQGEWPEGGTITMTFSEAVARSDCDAVGYEGLTPDDLAPALDEASVVEEAAAAPTGEG